MCFDGGEQGRGRAIRAHPLGVAGRSRDAYNTGKFVASVVPHMQLICGSVIIEAYLMKWHGLYPIGGWMLLSIRVSFVSKRSGSLAGGVHEYTCWLFA
jgi:hypothetical protein